MAALESIIPLTTPLRPDASSTLKLEYQQPGGSYKIRGIHQLLNELPHLPPLTVLSAGNMARTLLMLAAHRTQITVRVPDSIPQNKEAKLRSFNCKIEKLPMIELWAQVEASPAPKEGVLVHPIDRPEILRGYSQLAYELITQHPQMDQLLIPFGVGGLFLGVAETLKRLRPDIRIIAVESSTQSTLTSTLTDQKNPGEKSWVDAIGTPYVLPRVLMRIRTGKLLDEIHLVDPAVGLIEAREYYRQTGDRLEGAAALSLAASRGKTTQKILLNPPRPAQHSVAVLTGANVNPEIYVA